jgi:zinc protease
MNRAQAPEFVGIESIEIQTAKHTKLDNDLDLYYVNAGSQDIVKIELLFPAGMYHQSRSLIASAANNMLVEGTSKLNADQLADQIDYFGAFFEHEALQDSANVTLYTLKKYMGQTLPLFFQSMYDSILPEKEFATFLNNKKQKHIINNEKVSIIARRHFSHLLFQNHPYGLMVNDNDFDTLKLKDVQQFYHQQYQSIQPTIVLSGKVDESDIAEVSKTFGHLKNLKPYTDIEHSLPTLEAKKHFIEKKDAIQSAIRIGRLLFNKTHKDYFGMQVLNCILGGYFGSRLMANIREDKGYTYGIGSGIASLKHAGYFYISTEVGVEVTKNTLEEIYKEILLLRNELVTEDELETVKSYMLGNILRSIDGPFALAEKFKSVFEYGLDYSYYNNYIKAIKNIQPKDLQNLANQYLQEKDLLELVVGKL